MKSLPDYSSFNSILIQTNVNSVTRVEFLRFIISVDGVSMNSERVATIKD